MRLHRLGSIPMLCGSRRSPLLTIRCPATPHPSSDMLQHNPAYIRAHDGSCQPLRPAFLAYLTPNPDCVAPPHIPAATQVPGENTRPLRPNPPHASAQSLSRATPTRG